MTEDFSTAVAGVGARRLEPDAVIALVDASPDGVMVVDADGVVVFANPAALDIFALPGSELVGSEFGIPLVSMDKVDIDVVRGTGTPGVFELRVTDASWRGGAASLVTVRDVTERANHEAQVHQLNQELRLRADAAMVLDHVGDGVVLLDPSGVVQMWNPAAEQILGRSAAAMLGCVMVDAVPGWRQLTHDVPLVDALDDGQPAGHSVLIDVDGEERWLSVTGAQFDRGTVYAFHDLTDEVRVATLKRDFIDTASHELRTPLTSIYGAAHTLRREDLDLDPQIRDELVEVILTQSRRLQRITENILATRKLDHDTLSIRSTRFDAVELAHDVADGVRLVASDAVRFSVDVSAIGDPRDTMLVADEDKLRQVLSNLVQNAAKYSPDGGDVCIAVDVAPGALRFTVRDEGIGMSPDDRDHAFEKFYRSSTHEGRTIEGTGLGLYIARELVQRMDGDIGVELEPGKGSTFTVTMPRRGGDPARADGRVDID